MAKKEIVEVEEVEKIKANKIKPIALGFGREDLDGLATKLNEVISFINERE